MAQQQSQFNMVVGVSGGNHFRRYHDTTYTKLFVGGLAWETQGDTVRSYFEQFGEILEAVVITDRNTGRSKGYGFVTFKEPEAAFRACQNPAPLIDGRRANCNLAFYGAQKPEPPPLSPQHGATRSRAPELVAHQHAYAGPSSACFHQPSTHIVFPYPAYGYVGYPHDALYPGNYYGGQQFPPYYTAGGGGGGGGGGAPAAAAAGHFHHFYPYYFLHASQSSQASGFAVQFPHHMLQQQQQQHYPFLHQHHHFASSGILSLPTPSSIALPSTTTTITTGATTMTLSTGPGSGPSQTTTVISERKYSSS